MRAILSGEIKGKFELVGDHHDHVVTGWGEIRFSKLTEKHADSLIARGYLGIRRVTPADPQKLNAVGEQELSNTEEKLSAKRRKKEDPEG